MPAQKFIFHRHSQEKLASALRESIQKWVFVAGDSDGWKGMSADFNERSCSAMIENQAFVWEFIQIYF